MTFKYRYRKQIIIGVLIFVLLLGSIGGGIFLYQNNKTHKSKVNKKEVLLSNKGSNKVKKTSTENKTEKSESEEKKLLKVDIKGEVVNPGLYSLEEESRVSDVINMAGGLTEIGDTTVINLSKKIFDEMVIIIYSRQEVEDFKKTEEIIEQVIDNCQNGYNGIENDACINKDGQDTAKEDNASVVINGKISINTATLEELQTLPGIGEAKAQNIIKYREEHNGFQNIDELKEVTGIGESIYAKIKENITL